MSLSQSYQARAISTARFLLDKEEKTGLPAKEEVQHKWDAAKKLVVDVVQGKPPDDPLKSPIGSMTPNSRSGNRNQTLRAKPNTSPNQGNALEPQSSSRAGVSARLSAQTLKLRDTRDGTVGVAGSSSKDNPMQKQGHEVSAGNNSNISISGIQDLSRQPSGGTSVQRQSSKLLLPELHLPGQFSFAASGEATSAARPLSKSAVAVEQYRKSSSRDSDADSTISSETSETAPVTSRPKRFSDSQTQLRVSFIDSVPALKHSSSLQSAQSRLTAPVPLGPPPVVSRSRSSVELMRLRHLLENSSDSYSTAARAKARAENMQQQWQATIREETGDSNSSDSWQPIRRTLSANDVYDAVPSTQSAAATGSAALVRRSNSLLQSFVDVSVSTLVSGNSTAPVSVTRNGSNTLLWPTHGPTAGSSAQKGNQLQRAASSSSSKGTVASASALAAAASQATTTTPAASATTTTGKIAAAVQRVFSGSRSNINRPNSHKTGYKNQSLGFRPHEAPVDLINERVQMAVSELDSTRYDTIMDGLVGKQPQSKQPGGQPHRQGKLLS